MKVRYSFPARGKLRKSGSGNIPLSKWLFRFVTAPDTEYVERLVIEIADIPQEEWPTLVKVEQDPNAAIPRFPFEINPKAHSIHDIEPQLINLESYLSVFGLEEIVFSEISVEWIPENGDATVGMQSSYSASRGKRDDPANPLSDADLARCIVASATGRNETWGLAHFRVALANFHEGRFIETVRHSYLCLEQLYAGGKHQEQATIQEFLKSQELASTIENTCLNGKTSDKYFSHLQEKHESLKTAATVEDILRFLFRLRGELQHEKPSKNAKWHPSRQSEFENEALFLINLAWDVCFDIVVRDMRSALIGVSMT